MLKQLFPSLVILMVVGVAIMVSGLQTPERASPSNWINEDQISLTQDHVRLDIADASWAQFTNTNSMDPVIDENSHAIQVKPDSAADIKAGDIVAYNVGSKIVIHRVSSVDMDSKGIYYTLQGDNSRIEDPGKIRFTDVVGVVVAVIY